jgi:hypothetical protein
MSIGAITYVYFGLFSIGYILAQFKWHLCEYGAQNSQRQYVQIMQIWAVWHGLY